jgi:hypothetical protein
LDLDLDVDVDLSISLVFVLRAVLRTCAWLTKSGKSAASLSFSTSTSESSSESFERMVSESGGDKITLVCCWTKSSSTSSSSLLDAKLELDVSVWKYRCVLGLILLCSLLDSDSFSTLSDEFSLFLFSSSSFSSFSILSSLSPPQTQSYSTSFI